MSAALDWVYSGVGGVARGFIVELALFPLEVIKIKQQCSGGGCLEVAKKLFREEGVGAFFQGLKPQLMRVAGKQVFVWPTITQVPLLLEEQGVGAAAQQVLTGIAIATLDAGLLSPFERAKIISAFSGKEISSWQAIFKGGWRGAGTQWAKLSVSWVSFLVVQQHLRDRYSAKQQKPLTLPQLATIGVQTGLVSSFLSAPFDVINTRKQAQGRNISDLFSENVFRTAFRGYPLHAFRVAIHGVASVILIDLLTKKPNRE